MVIIILLRESSYKETLFSVLEQLNHEQMTGRTPDMRLKTRKRLKIFSFSIIGIIVVILGGFYIYTLDYYRADDQAQEVMAGTETEENRVQKLDNMWVFYPDEEKDSDTGLIFYPGGKVEATAYSPLLAQLSQSGITCVLIKMPFNLAVFDIHAADRVYKQLPSIQKWYIGGHSLGGAMASSYANSNSDKIEGLILLGAYPVGQSNVPVLALYGSEDKVLNRSKLDATDNKREITGGNHAYFGNYGEQKGDGTATITREQQQRETVEEVAAYILDEAE